ncbi:hypothetical protein [Pedobacter frigiditerrae]|uniref:hypothetical protein n=1 Tax=Pedobacter frigiditerrae TaxID=2530452 RepID=UPI00292D3F5D|nr:hypothetical protein [Pedobacter frigiditerrae]
MVNKSSGEILNPKQTADYGNMIFNIFPNGRVLISGSLHKLYNHILGQAINHDVFTYRKVSYTIGFLEEHFKIDPKSAKISNLEFGVNIEPTVQANTIIASLIVFKQHSFNKMNVRYLGCGIHCYMREYGIKVYNKGIQYNCEENILRFEKKIIKMRSGFDTPLVLADLLDKVIWHHCGVSLIADFNDVIIDETINKAKLTKPDLNVYIECINPLNWEKFTRRQRSQKKARFNNIMLKYGKLQIKNEINNLIRGALNQMLSTRTYDCSPLGFTIGSSIPNWQNHFREEIGNIPTNNPQTKLVTFPHFN